MKKLLTTLIALTLITGTFIGKAFAQNPLFGKYGSMDNVEYVCITSPMLKLIGGGSTVINGVEIKGITNALKSLLIINAKEKNVLEVMKKDYQTLRQTDGYDVYMEVKDPDSNEHVTTIIGHNPDNDKEVEVVMSIDKSGTSHTFIVLTGKFTDEQLAKLLKGKS
ncbi:MAG: DUF4252 domain-containing protein [Bacteroidales bacterium]|nr:DUF4252 domain-containing protein [Candidatus Liminaster caballi]